MHYRERDLYAVWQPHLRAQFDAGVPGNAKQAAGPSQEEVKLTSLHVNVYYFCEEELRPRMHSVHLDAVNW